MFSRCTWLGAREQDGGYEKTYNLRANNKTKTEDVKMPKTTEDVSPRGVQYAEDFISNFSGQDHTYPVSRWVQDIEDNTEIFEWTPLQQLVIARRSLTGTAGLWLRSERPFKSWTDLKQAISKEFPDAIDQKTIHEMMSARKKKPDESCMDYVLIMKELGKRGKMPDYVAIKYIVDGIQDLETNKILLYGVTSYSDLKEKLKIYENVKEKMKARRDTQRNQGGNGNNRNPKKNSSSELRCYNCGELNHSSQSCPHKEKGLKCFKCNEFGHISTKCTASTKREDDRKPSENFDSRSSRLISGGGDRQRCQHDGRRSGRNPTNPSTSKSAMFTMDYVGPTDSDDENNSCHCHENKEVMQIVNKPDKKPGKPILSIFIENTEGKALIDSGSDVNLMSEDFYDVIGQPKTTEDDIVLSGLGLKQVRSFGKFTTCATIDGRCYDGVIFHVVPKDCMPYCIILGHEFLASVTMVMNEGSVLLLPSGEEWMRRINCFTVGLSVVVGSTASPNIKKEVLQCVNDYKPTQVKEAPIQLKIILKDDIPVAQKPRRLSLREQQIVEDQVKEWLDNNIVQVSFSEYASPLVLVRKKDGSTRVCVDYRQLNKKMIKDEYPLPVIEDLIDKLRDSKVFSVLDLKNGFFHLKVSQESIHYTSFVTHHGQFEFLRAPFGLSNCPKYFMRFVSTVFRSLIDKGTMLVFIDDIIIPAKDEVQGMQRLKEVLSVASEYGLQINWKKAKLLCSEVEYLGHCIQNGEISPSSEKTDAVMRYPEPRTTKQVHSFIGLTSYFRKYVENYATIAKPLTDLLKQNAVFIFEENQRNAFNFLKQKLACSPVLKIYNPKLPTEVHTDASSIAYSAILLQQHPESGLHPVQYMSRKTNDAEQRYSSYELEALAIIEAVKKFRHYLYGIRFKIVTDCQAFALTLKKKDLSAKIARWVLFLDQYDFEVEHRKGSKMRHVDALSRHPYISAMVVSLHDQVKESQIQDEGLKAIIEIVKEKPYSDYWLENNILYKGDQKQLVIPRSMEREIIRRVHANGHFGKRKMKELLAKDFYIKDIDKKIDDFIVSCIPCLLASKKQGKQEGFLNPIQKEESPLHTLHMDHIGPLTETRKRYNHILTIVDAFTKFLWLFPTKSTTSSETLDKLKIHQQTFGNPERIVTDRGTAFTSHDFGEYCDRENIQHIKITTGVPRGNGQVERIHGIIIPILTKLCVEDPSVWYKHVSQLQRAINSTFQRSINTSPFELLTGVKMKSKEDIPLINLLQHESLEQFNEEREELRKRAKEQILKIQEENTSTYNKKRKESTKYEVGERVAIQRTQFGPGLKLKPKYLGPYRITKVKRNDRYDVEKDDVTSEGPIKTTCSADGMKRWPNNSEKYE